jgi:hypothetical protein
MTTTANFFPAAAPVMRRVRAFFAPVDRAAGTPSAWEPAQAASFNTDAAPAPWIDLGYVQNFVRKSQSKSATVMTGAPAAALTQVRESVEATVSLEFLSWTKLTMALATGSQHMNVLSGAACAVQSESTASSIVLNADDAAKFAAGQIVAVDCDYAGQTGFVGSPIAGAYVRQALSDGDYIRRVTFNAGMIAKADDTGITLAAPLPGGVPAANAKVQALSGFVDREGGAFRQEWSGLFVVEGTLGEKIFFYYPRLQPCAEADESALPLTSKGRLARVVLKAQWLALPVNDPLDGERVVCWRTFVPACGGTV